MGTQYHFFDWHRFPATQEDEATVERLRRHRLTGRLWGHLAFLQQLERRLGRALVPGNPGRAGKRDGKWYCVPNFQFPSYIFMPLVLMPWMNVFWAKKNRTTIGMTMSVATAIIWPYSLPYWVRNIARPRLRV